MDGRCDPDCTIIIPVPRPDPSADIESAPRITFRVRARCLSARSVFLGGLLAGIAPLDLVQHLSPSRPASVPSQSRLPRLLSSPPSHPVIFLPVPDPCSIQPLFRWMCLGTTDHIQNALDQGLVRWEGLARNVEYLCLSTDIKVFLGRWYRDWCLPTRWSPDCTPFRADEDDQSDPDSDCDTSDSDDRCLLSSTSTDDETQGKDGRSRGRNRDVKPLIQLYGRLRLCTT